MVKDAWKKKIQNSVAELMNRHDDHDAHCAKLVILCFIFAYLC